MTIDISAHKNILVRILKDIYTNITLARSLGFKGGTAVLLLYNLDRFSVDLDFDLLNPEQEEYVYQTISEILKNYGSVKTQQKRYSLFFLLSYTNKLHGAQNIKVEINKRNFGSQYEIKQYLGIKLQVMIPADIAAHKLVAMYERMGKANRDIYDVYFFLQNHWPINKKIIEQRTGMTYKTFLQTCINELEKLPERGILAGLGELLDAKQKAWVKANLKSDTIFLLNLALSNE